jgi:hypothetical protein
MFLFNYYSTSRAHAFQITRADEAKGQFQGKYQSRGTPPVDITGGFHFFNDRKVTSLTFTAGGMKFVIEAPYRDDVPYYGVWNGQQFVLDGSGAVLTVRFEAKDEMKYTVETGHKLQDLHLY